MKRIYLNILICGVLWAGLEVGLKLMGGNMHPMQVTFSRLLVGGIFLMPMALSGMKKRGAKLDRDAFVFFALLGFFGIGISCTACQLSTAFIPSYVTSAITAGNPIFIALLGFMLYRESISPNKIVSLVFNFLGIVMIIAPWNIVIDLKGVIIAFIAPMAFSVYTVLGKRYSQKLGGVAVTCFCFIMSAAELMLLCLLGHIPAVAAFYDSIGLGSLLSYVPFFSGYSLSNLLSILYVFLGGSGIAYACYFIVIEEASPLHASLAFFAKPVLSPLIAFLILHETIKPNELAGMAAVFLGLLLFILPDFFRARKEALKA